MADDESEKSVDMTSDDEVSGGEAPARRKESGSEPTEPAPEATEPSAEVTGLASELADSSSEPAEPTSESEESARISSSDAAIPEPSASGSQPPSPPSTPPDGPEEPEELPSPERREFEESIVGELGEDTDETNPEDLIGLTIDDRYELRECVGKGGMGIVYRAHQEALGRDVVIKVLPESLLDDPEAVARFRREARQMSQLEHPHVVSTYDFGRESDFAYICMEYVEGFTLHQRVSRGRLTMQEFCPIAVQLLQGLGDAHAAGMVHRDIKPSNIMLCERRGFDNYVKLLDFGLAKLLKGTSDVTGEKKLVGSVSFLAPEQIVGNAIDERVDVYSTGILFYYMLSGQKPFTADDDIRVLYQHVHNTPEFLYNLLPEDSVVPAPLIDLVHRCLSKDPENRPVDANDLLIEFTTAVPPHLIRLPWATGEFSTATSSQFNIEPSEGNYEAEGETTPVSGPQYPPDDSSIPGTRSEPTPSDMRRRPGSDAVSGDSTKVDGIRGEEEEPFEESELFDILTSGGPPTYGAVAVAALIVVLAVMAFDGDEASSDEANASQQTASAETGESSEQASDQPNEEKKAAAEKKGAAETPATLRVAPTPAGKVTIDGEDHGQSPVEIELEPGGHVITVDVPGQKSWKEEVVLMSGGERALEPDLKKEPEKAGSPTHKRTGRPAAGTNRGSRPSTKDPSPGSKSQRQQPSRTGSSGRGTTASGRQGTRPSAGGTTSGGTTNTQPTAEGSKSNTDSKAAANEKPADKAEEEQKAEPSQVGLSPSASEEEPSSEERETSGSEDSLLPVGGGAGTSPSDEEEETQESESGGGLLPVED